MKLSAAESTRAIVDVDGVPCRVWVAITEDGRPCYLLVHRVAIAEQHRPAGNAAAAQSGRLSADRPACLQ